MDIQFKAINIEAHFSYCIDFRRDAYFCSFQILEGFEDSITNYKNRMQERINQSDWFYIHIWSSGEIIGQLEFKSFSDYPETGYIHLLYIIPRFRGSGVANKAHNFILETLISNNCKKAILSVSRSNQRALNHYKRFSWEYFKPHTKHALTDYYVRDLSDLI